VFIPSSCPVRCRKAENGLITYLLRATFADFRDFDWLS